MGWGDKYSYDNIGPASSMNSAKLITSCGCACLIRSAISGKEADWKAYNGEPMPKWHELPDHIQVKWRAATAGIVQALTTEAERS